jgi:hypothetical protein
MKTFAELGKEIGETVQKKQEQYGDAFGRAGRVLRELYPDGVKPEQYDSFLAVTRLIDKLFRVATAKDDLAGHAPCPHCNRGFESPGFDIAGYGLLLERNAIRSWEEKQQAPQRG